MRPKQNRRGSVKKYSDVALAADESKLINHPLNRGNSTCRDTLPPEGMVREKAQEFIQQIMEEEVTELLGREKAERRSAHSWRAVPHNHLHHSFIGSSKITQDRSTVDICAARAATPSRLHSHFFPVRIDLFHDRNCLHAVNTETPPKRLLCRP